MNDENDKLLNSLYIIFQKIKTQSTQDESQQLLGDLLKDTISNKKRMQSLIQQLTAHNLNLLNTDKKESLLLLPGLFQSAETNKQLYPYLDKLLLILQSSIADDTAPIYPLISKTFSEATMALISMHIRPDQLPYIAHDTLEVYEKMKLFCLNNMKSLAKSSQIVGTLCLTNFIEACFINYKSDNLKQIWELIIYLIDKKSFMAKLELLNCLISLIFSSEAAFRPFATVTLYKILDYLTDSDWLKRKLALNVVYTLVYYCQSEIIPLHEYITEFLEVLRSDKVVEVREVCLQTLKYINEHAKKTNQDTDLKQKSKKTGTKSSLKRSADHFSTIKQLSETNILKEDIERRAKTPLMRNGNNHYFGQKTDDSSKKMSISTKKIAFPKKSTRASSLPKAITLTPGELSHRNEKTEDRFKDSKPNSTSKAERSPKDSQTIPSKSIGSPSKMNNNEALNDISFKLQTYMEIHANHINSLNDSIQGLAHRVRLLENELDYKAKKEKRKQEFKAEKKKKNYEKAFKLSLELKAKYILQIIRKMKENDYKLISIALFEDAVDLLFNDIDGIVNNIHIALSFISKVQQYCQLSLHSELVKKIKSNCNEILSLKDEYCLTSNDIELAQCITSLLNE